MNSAIDSFNFKIDTGFVNFTEAGTKYLVNEKGTFDTVTGEISESEFKREAYQIKENGISSRILVRNIQSGFGEEAHKSEVLQILINSKMLRQKYLLGINKETIRDIYNYLMSLGLFHIYFEDFINRSTCTDIDFKTDKNCLSPDKAKGFFKYLSLQGGELTEKKDNLGLQFSYRQKENKYISKPFVKFYHKGLELMNSSTEFYKEYLKGSEVSDICRLEATIKNNSHLKATFKSLKIRYTSSSLGNLLELSQNNIEDLITLLLSKHIDINNTKRDQLMDKISNNNLSRNQKALVMAMKYYLTTVNGTFEGFLNMFTEDIKSRATIFRTKKELKELYTAYLSKDTEVVQRQEFRDILREFCGLNRGDIAISQVA